MSRKRYRKRYSEPPPRDSLPPTSSGTDYGAFAALGIISVTLLCCAGAGGVMLYQRFGGELPGDVTIGGDEPVVDVVDDPLNDDPLAGIGAVGPSADQRAQALAAMRPRYRPGPHVTVQGLLPSGLTNQAHVGSLQRSGHTLDNPWIVPGGQLRPGNAPTQTGGSGPSIRLRDPSGEPLHVVAGVPAELPMHSEGTVAGAYVYFEGYQGHFFIPSVVDTELGQVRVTGDGDGTVRFGIDAPITPEGNTVSDDKPLDAVMHIAVIDDQDRVSSYVTRNVRVMPLGTGDLEVTLSMTKATDLDLYVVDATGTTISYQNRNSTSGGRLDLDANAGCGSNMGVNTEHVFFSSGRAPAGAYQVRVSNYESCFGGGRVDYTITIRNCGETAVLAGFFTGNGDAEGCNSRPADGAQMSCQQVVDFDVTPCEAGATAP